MAITNGNVFQEKKDKRAARNLREIVEQTTAGKQSDHSRLEGPALCKIGLLHGRLCGKKRFWTRLVFVL